MSRSSNTISGLKALLDYVPRIPAEFFESSRKYLDSVTRVDSATGATANIEKNGYTSSGVRMIHYFITISGPSETSHLLKVYVMPSDDDDPEVSRRLVAIGLEHLINTGVAVKMTTKGPSDL